MSAAVHVANARRYENAARTLHDMLRVSLTLGNQRAAAAARENRDVARRLHLAEFAEALAAGWVLS